MSPLKITITTISTQVQPLYFVNHMHELNWWNLSTKHKFTTPNTGYLLGSVQTLEKMFLFSKLF